MLAQTNNDRSALIIYKFVRILQSFPDVYLAINKNNRTGNFLNMVINEQFNDMELHKNFPQQWKQVDFMDRYQLNVLKIRFEAASPALFEFLLQDHMPFWNFMNNGSASPLPAILITDTGRPKY